MAEQGAQRHLQLQRIADLRQQAHRQQRMPAELEEVVVAADRFALQHGRPDARQRGLHRTLRRFVAAADVGVALRRRQRLAVELAVDRQRQRVEHHVGARQHVVGQFPGQAVAQRRGVQRAARLGHEVGDQPLVAGLVLARQHHGVAHAGLRGQLGLDLAQFDAEAADLDLVVVAPEEFEGAVGQPLADVPGLVQARAGHVGHVWRVERIGDEALGRQRRPVQIAARQAGSADVELALHAHRHRLQRLVQQIDAQVGERRADAAARAGFDVGASDRAEGGVHGDLGDPVHVDQACALGVVALDPRPQRVQLQRLAAEHDAAQPVRLAAVRLLRDQLLEGARRLVQHRHAFTAQQRVEVARRARAQRGHHHQSAAVGQRAPDLPDREVEGEGMEERPDIVGAEVELVLGDTQQAHDIAVLDHHALGPAGRAGGVDHVDRMRRQQRLRTMRVCRVDGGHAGQACLGVRRVQHQPRRAARQQPGDGRVGDHPHRLRIVDHEGQPILRVVRIERQVGRAGLEHREQRHHQVEPARQGDGDEVAGSGTLRDEVVRESVGAAVEFGVGQGLRLVHHGDGVGGVRGLLLEQLLQGGVGRRVGRRVGVDVGAGQQALPLGRRQHGQAVDRPRIVVHHVVHHGLQQGAQIPGEACDGVRLEQGRGVLDAAADAVSGFLQGQREIELGRGARLHAQRRRRQPGQRQRLLRRVLPHEDDLEQRVARQAARRAGQFDHVLERHVLVLLRGDGTRLHLPEQRADARRVVQVDAQRQHVGEEAD